MGASMSAGEFRARVDALGLTVTDVARLAEVHERTARAWVAGKYPVPAGVEAAVTAWEDETDRVVYSQIGGGGGGEVLVFRDDEAFRAARPDLARWSARWWRVIAVRVADELGVGVRYADEAVT